MTKRITVNYINSLTSTTDLQNVYESLSVDANYMYWGARDNQAIWERESFLSLKRRWEATQERMTELNILNMDGDSVKNTNFSDILA